MTSGDGAHPIFFNEKIKIGRPEHSLTPHSPKSGNISFLPYLKTSYVHHRYYKLYENIRTVRQKIMTCQ